MNLWRRRGRRGLCERVGHVTRTERLTFLLQSKQNQTNQKKDYRKETIRRSRPSLLNTWPKMKAALFSGVSMSMPGSCALVP